MHVLVQSASVQTAGRVACWLRRSAAGACRPRDVGVFLVGGKSIVAQTACYATLVRRPTEELEIRLRGIERECSLRETCGISPRGGTLERSLLSTKPALVRKEEVRRVIKPQRLWSGRIRALSGSSSSSQVQNGVPGPGKAMEKVQISRNGGKETFDAYLIGPKGAPGVIAVQEWWGVDYEIKNHASTISKKGFRALVPDLYRGKVALEAAEAAHLMGGLDWQGAVEDIRAAAKYLRAEGSRKVGVCGFCMGGALTIAASVLADEIDACVAFYGVPPDELADANRAKKPIQAHCGENDGYISVDKMKELEAKLKHSGVDHEIHIYPGVGHAFMNSSKDAVERKKKLGMGEHNPALVQKAWGDFERWFGKYLH